MSPCRPALGGAEYSWTHVTSVIFALPVCFFCNGRLVCSMDAASAAFSSAWQIHAYFLELFINTSSLKLGANELSRF